MNLITFQCEFSILRNFTIFHLDNYLRSFCNLSEFTLSKTFGGFL